MLAITVVNEVKTNISLAGKYELKHEDELDKIINVNLYFRQFTAVKSICYDRMFAPKWRNPIQFLELRAVVLAHNPIIVAELSPKVMHILNGCDVTFYLNCE
jgi:hypothetical protein